MLMVLTLPMRDKIFGAMKNRYCHKFVLSKVSSMDVCAEKKTPIAMLWTKIFFDCVPEFLYFQLSNPINDLFTVK